MLRHKTEVTDDSVTTKGRPASIDVHPFCDLFNNGSQSISVSNHVNGTGMVGFNLTLITQVTGEAQSHQSPPSPKSILQNTKIFKVR